MSNIPIDYTGKKIKMFTVVEFSCRKRGTNYWKCICDCGKEVIVPSGVLSEKSKTKSCGCYKKLGGSHHPSWKGVGDIGASFLSNLKGRIRYFGRKIDDEVTLDYLWNLFLQQNKKCALSGIELKFPVKYRGITHGEGTASLDRIDSSKEYIRGNLQWVHKDLNFMKQHFDEKLFFDYCKKVYFNLKDRYEL